MPGDTGTTHTHAYDTYMLPSVMTDDMHKNKRCNSYDRVRTEGTNRELKTKTIL